MGEGAGAWITIYFDGDYELRCVTFIHRATSADPNGELFEDVSLAFYYSRTAGPFTLDNIKGSSKSFAINNGGWETGFAKVSVSSAYSTGNNGFSEIIFYGNPWIIGMFIPYLTRMFK